MSQPRNRKLYDLQYARGHRRLMPARAVTAHIHKLQAQGVTMRQIAKAAGVPAGYVAHLSIDRYDRTNAVRGRAVLQVTARRAQHVPGAMMPTVGARRRIQALMALGWNHAAMHDASGVWTSVILSQPGTKITWESHTAIAAMFDRLSMTPGPSWRTALRAKQRGYAPPLAWDEETIDDPHAKPDTGATITDTWAVRWENFEDLIDKGLTPELAAERAGVDLRAAERRHYRKLERERREGAA